MQRPAKGTVEDIDAGVPDDREPGLVRPHADLPGLVPGRESIYKLSFNLPLGKNEAVNLQARVRKNAFNVEDGNDSTLRADWSIRF